MGIHHDTYAGAGFPLFTLGNSPASLPSSLRHVVESEIERMIDWLDGLEPDPDCEPYLAGLGGPDDDREDDSEDAEASYGWTDARTQSGAHWRGALHFNSATFDEREEDDCDDEDTDHSGCGDNEAYWLEEKGEGSDLGATEDVDQERAWSSGEAHAFGPAHIVTDGEPDLGWANNGSGYSEAAGGARDDREDDPDFELCPDVQGEMADEDGVGGAL